MTSDCFERQCRIEMVCHWPEPVAATYAAAVLGRDAGGAPVTRIGWRPDAPFVPPAGLQTLSLPKGARLAVQHGFSLHAGVRISGSDRERLERLCRYVARPAIATLREPQGLKAERLQLADDGSVVYHLRRSGTMAPTRGPTEPPILIPARDRDTCLVDRKPLSLGYPLS